MASRTTISIQLRYNRFKEGREDVNDWSPEHVNNRNENIEAVKKMILDNSRITIRKVADNVGISFGSSQTTFTDVLSMKRASAKI